MPHREKYLFVCINRRNDDDPKGSCAARGSEEIAKALKAKLKEKGLSKQFRACTTSCLDMCEVGVAIAVEPDNVIYGGVKLSDVDEIVEALEAGELVEHLVRAK